MKIKRKFLEDGLSAEYKNVICCALYLNQKITSRMGIGCTTTEQVAQGTVMGKNPAKIAKETGFAIERVQADLRAIIDTVCDNTKGSENE